jgi:hypothetical protein
LSDIDFEDRRIDSSQLIVGLVYGTSSDDFEENRLSKVSVSYPSGVILGVDLVGENVMDNQHLFFLEGPGIDLLVVNRLSILELKCAVNGHTVLKCI